MTIQERLVTGITWGNWIVLAVFLLGALYWGSLPFVWGVLSGGLIVTVNFHLLARTLKKALQSSRKVRISAILIKYYIRFIASGILIFILLFGKFVSPLGLILGLSVVVTTMFGATIAAMIFLFSSEEAS